MAESSGSICAMIAIWLATHYSLTLRWFYLTVAACIFIFVVYDYKKSTSL
jgi:hypothetical protein